MIETYERKESDRIVSIGHEKLIVNVSGFARESVKEEGTSGILIFIPTGAGNSLLDLIKV